MPDYVQLMGGPLDGLLVPWSPNLPKVLPCRVASRPCLTFVGIIPTWWLGRLACVTEGCEPYVRGDCGRKYYHPSYKRVKA